MTKKSPRTGGRSRKSRVNAETPDLEKGKAAVKAVIQRLQATTDRYTAGDATTAPSAASTAPQAADPAPEVLPAAALTPATGTKPAPAPTATSVAPSPATVRPAPAPARPVEIDLPPAAEAPVRAPTASPEPRADTQIAPAMDGRTIDLKPHHDLVAREAYLIWRSRGGDAFENWILAEQRVAQSLSAGSRTS